MHRIVINGEVVDVTAETMKRIERLATEKKLEVAQAIEFCLEKVI